MIDAHSQDWSCLPQDKPDNAGRRPEGSDEEKLFRLGLSNMHLLFVGVRILILLDTDCNPARSNLRLLAAVLLTRHVRCEIAGRPKTILDELRVVARDEVGA